jgi:hypothetical protein
MFIYILFMIIIAGILVLLIHLTRLAPNKIFWPSNKIHREVGRAKDLSAPWYWGTCLYLLISSRVPHSSLETLGCLFRYRASIWMYSLHDMQPEDTRSFSTGSVFHPRTPIFCVPCNTRYLTGFHSPYTQQWWHASSSFFETVWRSLRLICHLCE